MRVLIVQLSDIHVTGPDDGILSRSERIAASVRGQAEPPDVTLLLFTGDLTYSGQEHQIAAIDEFVTTLANHLSADATTKSPTYILMIPGNHDCDFSGPTAIREILLQKIKGVAATVPDPTVVAECVQPQRHFFELRDKVAPPETASALFWQYQIRCDSDVITVNCINTAWLSEIHEVPASLLVPIGNLPDKVEECALRITALHHPLNWIEPDNARELRRWIERNSDIVFTGHEHTHTSRTQHVATGEVNHIIEGAVLQEHDGDRSAFVAVLIDTRTRRMRLEHYRWSGEIYSAAAVAQWIELPVAKRDNFMVSEGFREYLSDPGVNLRHGERATIHLSDVYVFPDFKEVNFARPEFTGIKYGERVLEQCLEDRVTLIAGAEQAGKTSFAKTIFPVARAKGLVPVIIRGDRVRSHDPEVVMAFIQNSYEAQYDGASFEEYRQLPAASRVIIIDDLHNAPVAGSRIEPFFTMLTRFAAHVIGFTSDTAQQFGELALVEHAPELRTETVNLRMLPLGHVRRDEMVEKWLLLSTDLQRDEAALARAVQQAELRINVVIGKNFVPAYPVFVLAILQGMSSSSTVDVNASAYGYFYELLIKNALAVGSTRQQYDVRVGYLTHVAYGMYQAGAHFLTGDELRVLHLQYEAKFHITFGSDRLLKDLETSGILSVSGDAIRFKYPYIRYYFIASYLRDHLAEVGVREQIQELCRNLNEEDANVLLFMAHLTKDSFLLEELMKAGEAQFAEVEPASLAGLLPGAVPTQTVLQLSYVERPVQEARRELLVDRDQRDARRHKGTVDDVTSLRDEYDAGQALVASYAKALRTAQILGQLIKNFPGSLVGEDKLKLATTALDLSGRSLGWALQWVGEGRELLLGLISEALRDEYPGHSAQQIQERTKATLFVLVNAICYTSVTRTAFAIGAPQLSGTFDRLFANRDTPFDRLVALAIKLDQFQEQFPDSTVLRLASDLAHEPLASMVLRHMVVTHFYLFHVKFDTKQRVCSKLGIDYQTIQKINPRRRLLPRST